MSDKDKRYMDFARIKNLVKGNGDKLIFMENGEPEAVVMSFTEYARIAAGGATPPARRREARHAADEPLDLPMRAAEDAPLPEPPPDIMEADFVSPADEYPPAMPGSGLPPLPAAAQVNIAEELLLGAPEMPVRLADIRLEDLPI